MALGRRADPVPGKAEGGDRGVGEERAGDERRALVADAGVGQVDRRQRAVRREQWAQPDEIPRLRHFLASAWRGALKARGGARGRSGRGRAGGAQRAEPHL